MGVLEIVLLFVGGVLAILSFVLPVAREEVPQETKELARGEIKSLVDQEMDSIRQHVDDVVDEAVGYAVEKTERSLERLTNEKIMAVNEYSDTVLQEIHKNHEEAMFLYDMLNSKHNNLKETVTEVNKTVKEVEETKREAEAVVNSFQQLKPESTVASFNPLMVETMQERELAPAKEVKTGLARLAMAQTDEPAQPQIRAKEEPVVSAAPVAPIAESPAKPPVDLSFMATGREPAASKNEQILKMRQQGKSKVAIAKELGLGVGEVKLVIDLYNNL